MNDDKYIRQQARFYLSRWEHLENVTTNGTATALEVLDKKIIDLAVAGLSEREKQILKTRYTRRTHSEEQKHLDNTGNEMSNRQTNRRNTLITHKEASKRLGVSESNLRTQLQDLQQTVGERLIEVLEDYQEERSHYIKNTHCRVAFRDDFQEVTGQLNPVMRLQQVKHYLRKWFPLQEKINNGALNDIDLIDAKILFLSLDELESNEVDLLREKYFHPLVKGRLPNQEQVSKALGLTINDYRKQLKAIETRLGVILPTNKEPMEDERSKAIGNLYNKK